MLMDLKIPVPYPQSDLNIVYMYCQWIPRILI